MSGHEEAKTFLVVSAVAAAAIASALLSGCYAPPHERIVAAAVVADPAPGPGMKGIGAPEGGHALGM